ncbi:MAG: T9SS type A sorting domain-containing protein [Bacteroidetes bacterium]|nr:T9SS type A sorting domain-containing protein [Bacteroidota bacterium]
MKKFILILNLFIGITFTSFAQNKLTADFGNAQAKLIKFYPNPATSVINFDFQKGYDKSYSFQIFNFIGKMVLELKNVSSHTSINIEDFYRGIYIFQLRDRNGSIVESGKFQVNK